MWSTSASNATLAAAANATDIKVRPSASIAVRYKRRKLIETSLETTVWFTFASAGAAGAAAPPATPLLVTLHGVSGVADQISLGGNVLYKDPLKRPGRDPCNSDRVVWIDGTQLEDTPSAPTVTPNPFLLGLVGPLRQVATPDVQYVHAVVAGRTFVETAYLQTHTANPITPGASLTLHGRRLVVLVVNPKVCLCCLHAVPVDFFQAGPGDFRSGA